MEEHKLPAEGYVDYQYSILPYVFEEDTWVQKILSRAYGLDGWKTELLLDFARIHFGPTAGYAQQYLFAAARAGKIAS